MISKNGGRRTGKNIVMLLQIQKAVKQGKEVFLSGYKYPQYLEDNIEGVIIEPMYDKVFHEEKLIGYKIRL